MKLRTKMEGPCVHAMGVCIDPEHAHRKQVMHLEHDAAVAHALVVALNESRNVRLRQGRSIEEWVEGRAAEILAGWGYPNTEYPADIGMADRKEVERGGG